MYKYFVNEMQSIVRMFISLPAHIILSLGTMKTGGVFFFFFLNLLGDRDP